MVRGTTIEAIPSSAFTQALRGPRSAAVAGVVFALLYGAALVLVRLAFPGDITQRSDWVGEHVARVSLALHLVAYSGIAFLWFMGVVRTRIGAREDRFLSTVFMGPARVANRPWRSAHRPVVDSCRTLAAWFAQRILRRKVASAWVHHLSGPARRLQLLRYAPCRAATQTNDLLDHV